MKKPKNCFNRISNNPGKTGNFKEGKVKINEKDRGQILRMAASIASGMIICEQREVQSISRYSVLVALEILEEADRQIQELNKN